MVLPTFVLAPYTCNACSDGHNTEPIRCIDADSVFAHGQLVEPKASPWWKIRQQGYAEDVEALIETGVAEVQPKCTVTGGIADSTSATRPLLLRPLWSDILLTDYLTNTNQLLVRPCSCLTRRSAHDYCDDFRRDFTCAGRSRIIGSTLLRKLVHTNLLRLTDYYIFSVVLAHFVLFEQASEHVVANDS